MDTKSSNKVKMYRAVQMVCASNEAVWNTIPAFVTAYDRFTLKISEIDQLIISQDSGIIGVKKLKDKERTETADLAYKIALSLQAFANETGDTLLLEQLHFSRSDLSYKASKDAFLLMNRVKDTAVQYAQELADYGILQSQIDDLVMHVEQLKTIFGSTRDAIIDRGKNTKLIQENIREIDGILKKTLDKLVGVIASDYHDFALAYELARDVVDQHGKKHKSGNGDDSPAV